MKETLLKKRYGIPAAFLIALILSGAVFAWYGFTTIKSETTVQELLSTAKKLEFSDTMHPSEANTWSFGIANSASVDYTVKADLTLDAPPGVSITGFFISVGDTWIDETVDLLVDDSVMFTIPANGTLRFKMVISAARYATPGDVSASFHLSRIRSWE